MLKLGTLPDIACKVSGILANCTKDDDANLTTLHPWLEATVEAFGPDRIVFGSDWPVCNLTKGLPTWLNIARQFFSKYTED